MRGVPAIQTVTDDIDLDDLRASRLWRLVPEDRRVETLTRFWADEDSMPARAEAVALLVKQLKFRPRSVMALPDDKKARHLASIRHLPEALASRLLVVYHLTFQRPLMGAFLDGLGIAHEDGVLSDELKPPDAEKVTAAATTLESAYPPDDVRLYFLTLVYQDGGSWAALRELLPS